MVRIGKVTVRRPAKHYHEQCFCTCLENGIGVLAMWKLVSADKANLVYTYERVG